MPVDLIEGRTSADLVAWLTKHSVPNNESGAQVITRDRSTEYTNAITQASPDAQQVADRWHLLSNMRDVVKHLLTHRRGEIEQTWKHQAQAEVAQTATPATTILKIPANATMPMPRGARERATSHISRERRKARFDQVKLLRQQGLTISQIARLMDMNRKTARSYFHADVFPERKKNKCIKTSIDPYVDYLQQRFDEGCRNVMQLFREVRTRGYTGSYKPVKRWMWLRREEPAPTTPKHLVEGVRQQIHAAVQQMTGLPSVRQLAWLLVRPTKDLNDTNAKTLNVILNNDVVSRVYDLAQRFGRMIREHDHDQLDVWLSDSASSGVGELVTFAKGIRADYAAIKAALTTKWSNGRTEGHINRLKMIKRLMFGRAKFDLLRIRVLHPT